MAHEKGDHKGWLWIAVGTIILILLVGVITLHRQPPQAHWYAVAAVLERREMAYRDIVISEPAASGFGACFALDCQSAVVLVTDARGHTLRGQIWCRDGEADCTLSVPALGIYGQHLPDRAHVDRVPRTFDDVVQIVQSWARGAMRSLRLR